MLEITICEACRRKFGTQKHHMFPQTKTNIKLYGALIDDAKNIQRLCPDCHLSKAPGVIIWKEYEFCKVMGIEKRGKANHK